MALDTTRDITHQLFPIQSPILIQKANEVCRVIVDYKNEIFLGVFDTTGTSLEDMLTIQSIYRLVEGGVAILFYNRDDAPFVHIIQRDKDGLLQALNIRGTTPIASTEEFVLSKNDQYNKLACLFPSPKKVERAPSFI